MLTLELLPLYMAKEGRDDGLSYIWPKDKSQVILRLGDLGNERRVALVDVPRWRCSWERAPLTLSVLLKPLARSVPEIGAHRATDQDALGIERIEQLRRIAVLFEVHRAARRDVAELGEVLALQAASVKDRCGHLQPSVSWIAVPVEFDRAHDTSLSSVSSTNCRERITASLIWRIWQVTACNKCMLGDAQDALAAIPR